MITRRTFLVASTLVVLTPRSVVARLFEDETIIALTKDPETLDPRKAFDVYSRTIVEQIYQTVLRRVDGAVMPGVADSCEPDPKDTAKRRWIVRIRPGLRFHNRDPLDAAAVRYSIEQSAAQWLKEVFDRIDVVSSRDLAVVTKSPYGPLPIRLCDVFVVPENYYYDSDGGLVRRLSTNPNGSGEYLLKAYMPGSHITLERFEDYSGKKPLVKKLVYRIIPEKSVQVAARRTGEIDITDDPPRTDFRDQLKQAGVPVVNGPGPIIVVGLNASALPDPQVRMALSLALDRKAIADQDGGEVIDMIFAPEAPATPRDPTSWYSRDSARAATLLKQRGSPKSLNVAAAGGLSTTAEGVASQWKALGLPAKADVMEAAAFRDRLVKKQLPEAYVLQLSTSVWDPDFPLSTYVASSGPFSTFKNEQADRLIREGREELPAGRRAEVYRRLLQILKEDPPFIPLYRERRFYGIAPGIVWRPRADGLILGRDIHFKR
jgi:peptide/nickel transport system substrate-binding protein